jgi:hypothetical protein
MLNRDRLLPIELVHEMFDYLSMTDILQAFSNINSYFDKAISDYKTYHIDFRSCCKLNFDRICFRIQPDHIVSLVLSNNDDTPDQFRLFFSQFNIKQFRCLRSMTLINIENDLLLNLINNLNNSYLQSFTIIPGCYSQKTLPKNALNKLPSYQLKRLDVYNASCINTQSIYYLQHLTVHDCEIIELQQILNSMLILRSLTVTNRTGGHWTKMDKVPIRLKRLVLNLGT